jgi:Fe2+ or Zn2+ uptake regulation protein
MPCTNQRRAVLEAVLGMDTHPTADGVHAHLSGRKLRISRATVFRTLESLVDLGLITKISHPGRGIRYDGIIALHHHLMCLKCNEMIDIVDAGLDHLRLPDTSALGFTVSDHRVLLRGLCKQCRKEEAR